MTISIIIPYRDCPFIWHTIDSLVSGVDTSMLEVIVVDDFSDTPLEVDQKKYSFVRLLRQGAHRGVGMSFDLGVKFAKGDILIFSGSDIITKDPSWVKTAIDYTTAYPNGMACTTCLSGDPQHLTFDNLANDKVRHGCELKPLLVTEERCDMMVGSWHYNAPKENINEVSLLMGARYITTKGWYQYIGGFDGVHRFWGGVEAWLSIKTWLMGGVIHNIRDEETIHIFSKYETPQNGRSDWKWFNAMFVAYTMMPEDRAKLLIDKCYSLRIEKGLSTYPFNLGKKLIKHNWDKVVEIREKNKLRFTRDWDFLVNKFRIDI